MKSKQHFMIHEPSASTSRFPTQRCQCSKCKSPTTTRVTHRPTLIVNGSHHNLLRLMSIPLVTPRLRLTVKATSVPRRPPRVIYRQRHRRTVHPQSTTHTRQPAQSASSSPSPFSENIQYQSRESATEPQNQHWEQSPAPSANPIKAEPSSAAIHSRSGRQEPPPSSRFGSPLAQQPLMPGNDSRSRSGQGRSMEGFAASPITNVRRVRGHSRSSEGDSLSIARLQREFDERFHALEEKYANQMRSLRAECAQEVLDVKHQLQNRIASLEERLAQFEAVTDDYED